MKVKLKLDRDELKGLITICQIFSTNAQIRNIIEFLNASELAMMSRRYTEKLMSYSKRFSIALTDFQVSILFEYLNECADNLQPFEKSVAINIIAQIDRQYINYRQMLLNFLGEKEQKQLN